MTGIGIKVSVPFLNNQTGSSKLNDLKSHMLGWYDVKRQGCTNESLAENPVLEDLSGKNHPLELKNFAFGGLSGMGGYGTDLTKWVKQDGATFSEMTPHKATVHLDNTVIGYRESFRYQNENKEKHDYFKVRTSVPGDMTYSFLENPSNTLSCYSDDRMTFEVYGKGLYRATFLPDNNALDYTIEILPNFPNSLVFNGVTPEYPVNKDNIKINTSEVEVIAYNKFIVTRQDTTGFIKSAEIIGNVGESLNVSFPSFIVRASGMKDKNKIQINHHDNVNGFSSATAITADGTYIIPAVNYTIEPTDENFIIQAIPFRAISQYIIPENGDAVTLEFLPNYPAPTTKMYGIIPTITQGAKCMMMDFVPTFPINNSDSYITYYTQRHQPSGDKYALMTNIGGLTAIAYNNFNSNGTYINGQLNNNKLKHVDLLNKRQVVSVNANEVYEMPANRGVVIAADETLTSYFPTMALNSLILFDRELTEEEMKLVMNKLMKYEDTDNVSGDLSRSAREMTLDDSDMYEEYGVYEDEQEIIEASTEFNDNTV